MRLLIVNSNTSEAVTNALAREARSVAAPGTEIVTVAAPFGPAAIETRGDLTIAAHATIVAFARHRTDVDGGIIACFGDPGLAAARQLMPFPVVGMAEAAALTACMLGGRFGIVTAGERLVQVVHELVAAYGLVERLAGIHALQVPLEECLRDRGAVVSEARRLCKTAVDVDGADVIVLGGAFLAGLAAQVADGLGVPVLSSVTSAVKQAEALVALGPNRSAIGSYAPPAPKEMVGLDPALAALFADDAH